jgi:phosphoglycerate dehydrogenase-like enzyme
MNVLLTPHIAAGTGSIPADEPARRGDYLNIVRFLNGEPVLHRVV